MELFKQGVDRIGRLHAAGDLNGLSGFAANQLKEAKHNSGV
jgi:hypothetical protein